MPKGVPEPEYVPCEHCKYDLFCEVNALCCRAYQLSISLDPKKRRKALKAKREPDRPLAEVEGDE